MHQLDKHDFLLWIRFCRDHMLSSQIRAFWNQTNEIWPRLIKWVELLNVIFEAGGFLDKCVPHAQAAARWAALEYSGRRPRWWREALEAKRRERERRLLRSDLIHEKPFILSLQTGGGKDNGDCDKEQRTGGYWRRLQISVTTSFGPLWTISTGSQWEISEVGRLSCFIEFFAWFHIVCGRYTSD